MSQPTQNYAVHKIPDIDEKVGNSVMCVMLRAALLPSMIVSKEIQEYSSNNYVTPFALFRISRDDSKEEHNMAYILDLERKMFVELCQEPKSVARIWHMLQNNKPLRN